MRKQIKLLSFLLFTISCDEETVNPVPPYCKQDSKHVCVSTSSAMLLKYWAKNDDILLDKKCGKYKDEMVEALQTPAGGAYMSWAPLLLRHLKEVAKKYFNKKNKDISEKIGGEVILVTYSNIDYIEQQMMYSKQKDTESPWDRPMVFMAGDDRVHIKNTVFRKHSVLIWGINYDGIIKQKEKKKEEIIVIFRIHNPAIKPDFHNRDSKYMPIYLKASEKNKHYTQQEYKEFPMKVIYISFKKKSNCKEE